MATKTQKLARGLLDKLESSGLYDMFDMSAVPDVPQQAMERYVPPRGMPPNLQGLLTPETASRLSDYAKAGEQVGGREWYNTEPLRYAFQDILGPEAGASQYGRFFDIVAATSPRSRVDSNIRRASYLYNRDAQGLPIAGLTNPDLPPGYGHLAHNTQDQLLADLQRSGQFSSMNRPKTSSFAENLKGNQFPMTIDTHNFSAVVGDPSFKKSPSKTQYKYLEDFQSEIADKLNMTPAQYQASVWMGAGTGVADARPFMQVFDDVLTRTAERDKKTKGQVLKDFIEGKAPLYSFAGAATLLGGTVLAPEDAEANPLTRSIRAYHGSPYRFDEFKREAIGTGEGNQAYGYGLYFAEAEDVAKAYKKAPEVLEGFDNFAMSEAADSYLYDLGESLRKSDPLLSNAISELRVGDFSPDVIKRKMKDLDDDFTAEEIEAAAARFDDVLKKINKDFSGSMYEVNLNVSPDDLIDWDKPISQQSDSVKKAIEASRQKLPPNALDDLGGDLSLLYGKDVIVGDFLGNMQAIGGRSDFGESLLGDLGVKGIRYKDQFSRGGDEGTNNYVIFDPRVIEISRTYSISIPQASELLAQQDRQRQGLLSQIDPVEQRVQQLMQPLAQEPGYNYGDILPIKRSTDPARREEFPYGLEPAIPNMARGLLEEAVRAYEMNKAGRQKEATQSALGLLF